VPFPFHRRVHLADVIAQVEALRIEGEGAERDVAPAGIVEGAGGAVAGQRRQLLADGAGARIAAAARVARFAALARRPQRRGIFLAGAAGGRRRAAAARIPRLAFLARPGAGTQAAARRIRDGGAGVVDRAAVRKGGTAARRVGRPVL